jgi:hypothetical protein
VTAPKTAPKVQALSEIIANCSAHCWVVTGERAIFLNMEWPKEYIGLKDLEAEAIVRFLMDFIRMGHDFQARIHWE